MRNTNVAAAIRAEIARQNRKTSEVARAAGKPQTWLWWRTNEVTAITVDDLQAIADALGVDVIELIARDAA